MSNSICTPVDIIRAKRNGEKLTKDQINQLVVAISEKNNNGSCAIHDAQIGAFLMAAFLKGLSLEETIQLTHAMTYSGFTFSWPDAWKGQVVDKHSTGGVGDKVSLILAPALAACGMKVPMVSGRGLDFTGGTLDKLEAIPGFNVSLSPERIKEALDKVGCCIVGQTQDLVPADRILYSIRDVTATVDNQDLIVASVMSKKAAESLDALVLDVKVGEGAFMKTQEAAKELASKLVGIGQSFGMKVAAVLTRMDHPIGLAIGNALEVEESILALRNQGPADLMELVAALGGKLLQLSGRAETAEQGSSNILEAIETGAALQKFRDMIVFQGTEPQVAEELCSDWVWKHLPKAPFKHVVTAVASGFIESIDALQVAKSCLKLGCGRTVPTDQVQQAPGVILVKKPGDVVTAGDEIAHVHTNEIGLELQELILDTIARAFVITEKDTSCLKGKSMVIDIVE